MDFDKFLEKDVIEFLDEESRKVAEKAAGLREEEFDLYEINQDYSKEINDALKDEDLIKARKVFEDVKDKYTKAPPNTLSKKRLYIIMEEMFEKIKDFENKEEGKKSLFDTIKEYEQQGLFTKPEMIDQKHGTSAELILGIIARKEKELEKMTSKKDITPEELKKAIDNYREIKKLVMKIPNSYAKDKARVFESALSWYYTLKKLKRSMHEKDKERIDQQAEKSRRKLEEEKRIPLETELAKVRKIKHAIVESHNKITEFIQKKDLRSSIEEYHHLKGLCESFPGEMEEEKTALLADALSLYESIKKLKESLEQKKVRAASERVEQIAEQHDREKIKKDILNRLGKINELAEKREAKSAALEYKEINKIFKTYPDYPLNDKKILYDQIVKAHKRILAMKGETLPPKAGAGKVDEIDACVRDAQNLLEKGSIEPATHKLLEAKHKIQMLPDEAFDEKYRLLREVEKLEHKTLFVKNMGNIDNPNMISS